MTMPFALLLLLCFSLLPMSVLAASDAEKNAQEPVLFSISTVKPWGMVLDGHAKGVLVDTTEALFSKTGIAYKNIYRPYSRVFHDLYSGTADFALVFDSENTEKLAIKVGAVTTTRVVVLGRDGSRSLQSLTDLQGHKVGFIRGSKYSVEFDGSTLFERQPMNTMQQGLAMLLSSRLDAMAAVDHTVYWGMREMNIKADRVQELFSFPGPTLSLYFSHKSQRKALLPRYRKALEALQREGAFRDIYGHAQDWID